MDDRICGTCAYWCAGTEKNFYTMGSTRIGLCDWEDGEYFGKWMMPGDKCPDWKEAKHGRLDTDGKGEA